MLEYVYEKKLQTSTISFIYRQKSSPRLGENVLINGESFTLSPAVHNTDCVSEDD